MPRDMSEFGLGDAILLGQQIQGNNLTLQREQMQLQQQKYYLQQMMEMQGKSQPGKDITTDDMSQRLLDMSGLAARSGMVKDAGDLANRASEIRERTARTRELQLQDAAKKIDLREHLFNGVHDQDTWNAAVMQYEAITGEVTGMRGSPYNPAFVKMMRDQGMSAKEKIDAERQQKNEQSQEAERTARIGLIREETRLAKAREQKLQKEGVSAKTGRGTAAAMKGDIKYADDLIATNYPTMDDKERDLYARQLSERALKLRAANPALSDTEASGQAYSEMENSGTFRNYTHARPKLNAEQKEQKSLVESYGVEYDPGLEYRVINGQLMSRPRK